MTREEELQKVAEDAFKVCCSGFVQAVKSLWVTAFNAGAYWADRHQQNVWHDASEEPEGYNRAILCQDTKGNCWVENMFVVLRHNNWDEYVKIEMVDKWAYIKDL